ncbi:hypothetical protein K3152_13090 [Qipengyuania sp. 1NDH17]|uniref:Uncharacterized protein n=1 Tax=Qipengyuania polymorpha TaxID=2867234 RepID=A0ABS7J036_9SPHN|nr:hypothetical protein [Qipengyuania polymorpha]MBX7459187.1 hypothetical protein [Qipengyuania polymorpha]
MASPGRADECVAGEAKITLELNLNPTTTRALAVRRNGAGLEDLTLARFFKPIASTDEAFHEGAYSERREIALDQSENVLVSVAELGGATPAERTAARSDFLSVYEAKLHELVLEMLSCATATAYGVEVAWGSLVLRQAELYTERRCNDPVALTRRLTDRGLDLARRIKRQDFWDVPSDGRPVPTSFAVFQDDGFPHLVVPLTGTRNVELSIYAKTNLRTRFEVRYRRAFGHHLRGCSTGNDRLISLLDRLAENATKRLPWRALGRAASIPPRVDVADVPTFVGHLVEATAGQGHLFNPLVKQVLLTGGAIDDDQRNPGISRAIGSLVRAGVLFRWQVQLKEQRERRRYGLTDHYAAVRMAMLSGFLPDDTWRTSDPDQHENDYDLAARIMGGRQWIEKPYE